MYRLVTLIIMLGNFAKTKYLIPALIASITAAAPLVVFGIELGWGTAVEGFFWDVFIGIGALFVWLGGLLLDFAIRSLVIGMGELLTTNVGIAVDQLWVIVRDIFNILFIFALVYIGIQTILDSESSGTRKLLGKLILAALLINFSLLITKTIVDFANIAAFQIYQQIQIDVDYGILEFADFQGKSISGAVMDAVGFSTIDDGSMLKQISDKASVISAQVIIYSFLMMILMVIMGLIFAASALILVKRFIMLIIFMIFSPVMFLGWILPNLGNYQSMWWKEFFKHAFIAPAFLFMMYLSLTVLRAMQPNGSFAQAYQSQSSEDGSFGIFLFFFVAAGFLIASMMVAQRMGSSAAGATLGILKNGGKAAQGFAGRNTIGRGSRGFENLNNALERTRAGRGLKGVASALSFGTFTERDRQKVFRAGTTAKFGGNYSRQDDIDWKETREKNQQKLRADANKKERKATNEKEREGILKRLDRSSDIADTKDEIDAIAKNLKQLGSSGKAELAVDILKREEVAINLNDDDVKAIEESGRFTPREIGDIKDARDDGFKNIAEHGITKKPGGGSYGGASAVGDSQRKKLMTRSTRDAGKLPTDVYLKDEMIPFLTPSTVAERMRNGGFKDGEIDDLRSKIESHVNALPGADPKRKAWKKWSEGSNQYAAELGLNIP